MASSNHLAFWMVASGCCHHCPFPTADFRHNFRTCTTPLMLAQPTFGRQGNLGNSWVSHSKFQTVPLDPLFLPSRYAFSTVSYGNWHDEFDPHGITPHWSPDDAWRPFESISGPDNALQASSEDHCRNQKRSSTMGIYSPSHDFGNVSR